MITQPQCPRVRYAPYQDSSVLYCRSTKANDKYLTQKVFWSSSTPFGGPDMGCIEDVINQRSPIYLRLWLFTSSCPWGLRKGKKNYFVVFRVFIQRAMGWHMTETTVVTWQLGRNTERKEGNAERIKDSLFPEIKTECLDLDITWTRTQWSQLFSVSKEYFPIYWVYYHSPFRRRKHDYLVCLNASITATSLAP